MTGGTFWEWWKNAEAVHLLSSHSSDPGQSAGISSPLLHDIETRARSAPEVAAGENMMSSPTPSSPGYRRHVKVVLVRYRCCSQGLETSRTPRQCHVDLWNSLQHLGTESGPRKTIRHKDGHVHVHVYVHVMFFFTTTGGGLIIRTAS